MILVSEVMLQQTQAERIALHLPVFLALFPNIHTLAAASNGTMIRSWKGLGYNSRALRLRDAAKAIVERFDGVVPSAVADLRSLPGIGPYASAAIACFAYGVPAVVIDVNVRRVLSRVMLKQTHTADVATPHDVDRFAQLLLPRHDAATWHHALMDFGATVCTARLPQCATCPLESLCPSAHTMVQSTLSRKKEPLFRGTPTRLWRGKVVAYLQTHHRPTVWQLLKDISLGEASANDLPVFRELLARLCADGLVRRSGHRVCLPE